jgi:dTMP kinase
MSDQAPFIPPAADEDPVPPAPWRVFRSPGFGLLFGAQFVSSLGDWTGLLAIIYIASKVSGGSGTGIGLVMVARMLPGFVLAPIGGVFLDRWNRKTVMVSCDIGRAVLLMILPFWDDLLGLVVISFLIEVLTLLWGPAKDASVPNVVKDPDQLASANTFGLVAAYGTILVGAVFYAILSGVSKWLGDIHYLGRFHQTALLPIWVDGLTFLVSALLISRLRLDEGERGSMKRVPFSQTWSDIVEGLNFVRSNPLVRGVMAGLAGGLIGGGMVIPLGPLFARDVLGGGDSTFATVTVALGVGATIGVVTLLLVQRRLPRQAVFTTAVVVTGSAMVGAGAVSSLAPALFLVALLGAGAGCAYVTGFTVLQESVSDDMRGRTFSTLYTLVRACLLLSLTIGPFIASALGSLAKSITNNSVKVGSVHLSLPGARLALWFGGLITILSGVAARRRMRMSQRIEPSS